MNAQEIRNRVSQETLDALPVEDIELYDEPEAQGVLIHLFGGVNIRTTQEADETFTIAVFPAGTVPVHHGVALDDLNKTLQALGETL